MVRAVRRSFPSQESRRRASEEEEQLREVQGVCVG